MTAETPDSADPPADPPRTNPGLRLMAVLGIGLLLMAAVAWYLVAANAFDRSGSASLPLAERAAAAARAHSMEPWSAEYERRSRLLAAWLLGKQQFERGDYNAAVETLDAAYRLDVGNQELLALNREAQEAQALATNRKAHLQHGHEGPSGTLRPQDIER